METSYLIVGLGNPGAEYAGTRHNAGFLLVERCVEKWRSDWVDERKFKARVCRVRRETKTVLVCEPQTFMNRSGEAVKAVADYYRVPGGQILLVVDDADLPLGGLRLRPGGSSGGHHGLESVQAHLGTPDFARLRIGIGRSERAVREISDHVLGAFSAVEKPLLQKVLERGASQIEAWLDEGVAKAMNKFNGAIGLIEKTKDTK